MAKERRKPVSDPQLAQLGKFQGLIERNSNFRQSALDHNLGRNVHVLKVLAFIGLMQAAGKNLQGRIDCTKAIRQNFSSSQSDTHLGLPVGPQQAAHFLPGQVRINSRPVWEYVNDPTTRGEIEVLFGNVEHLQLPYNQADSAAEAKGEPTGLCAALAQACRTMVNLSPSDKKNAQSWRIPWGALQAAYNDWHTGAMNALNNALQSKLTKEGLPPLVGDPFNGYTPESISARSTADPSIWNRENAVSILKYYLEDQQQRGWAWVSTRCSAALRDIEKNFRP